MRSLAASGKKRRQRSRQRRQRRLIPALKSEPAGKRTDFRRGTLRSSVSIKRKKRNAKKRSARSGARSRAFKENRKRGNYVIRVAFLVCDCGCARGSTSEPTLCLQIYNDHRNQSHLQSRLIGDNV